MTSTGQRIRALYLAPDRMGHTSGRGIEGAPTLAADILSRSTRTIDRVTKPRLYGRYVWPFLWIIDPDARSRCSSSNEIGTFLAVGAVGPAAVDLPPFTGLGLVPESLWT